MICDKLERLVLISLNCEIKKQQAFREGIQPRKCCGDPFLRACFCDGLRAERRGSLSAYPSDTSRKPAGGRACGGSRRRAGD